MSPLVYNVPQDYNTLHPAQGAAYVVAIDGEGMERTYDILFLVDSQSAQSPTCLIFECTSSAPGACPAPAQRSMDRRTRDMEKEVTSTDLSAQSMW